LVSSKVGMKTRIPVDDKSIQNSASWFRGTQGLWIDNFTDKYCNHFKCRAIRNYYGEHDISCFEFEEEDALFFLLRWE
jgi:hypothetical protein